MISDKRLQSGRFQHQRVVDTHEAESRARSLTDFREDESSLDYREPEAGFADLEDNS
jgi:hypothetical protein